MKTRKVFILFVMAFIFANLFAKADEIITFQSEGETIRAKAVYGLLTQDIFNWLRMGGDRNRLSVQQSLDGVAYLNLIEKVSPDALEYYLSEAKQLDVPDSLTFDVMVYSGVNPGTMPIIRIGKVKFGEGFRLQVGKAWEMRIPQKDKIAVVYWFENKFNFSNLEQCNNICIKFIPKEPVIKYLDKWHDAEPYAVHDTVTVTDTVKVEIEPSSKVCAWLSYAQDHPLGNNANRKDNHLIQSTMGYLLARLYIHDCALNTSIEWGYQDGPWDWKLRFAAEWNRKHKLYVALGEMSYYRDASKIDYITLGNQTYKRTTYFGVHEIGGFVQADVFPDKKGNNHVMLYAGQSFQPATMKVGTTEFQGSAKVEIKKLYGFAAGQYQHTPSQWANTLLAPEFTHLYGQLRGGIVPVKPIIIFGRGRLIDHEVYKDQINEHSLYTRIDTSLGIFWRPKTFLGISKIYWEAICGLSHVEEQFEDELQNTKQNFIEAKLTVFYNYKF